MTCGRFDGISGRAPFAARGPQGSQGVIVGTGFVSINCLLRFQNLSTENYKRNKAIINLKASHIQDSKPSCWLRVSVDFHLRLLRPPNQPRTKDPSVRLREMKQTHLQACSQALLAVCLNVEIKLRHCIRKLPRSLSRR